MIGWTWPQDCWWCGHVVSGAWRPSEDQIISVCWCGLTNITNDITSFYKWHLTSTSCRKVEPKLEGGNCHQCYILPTEKKTGSRLLHWDDQQNINSLPELSACCMWRSHPANINSKWSQLRAVFCILLNISLPIKFLLLCWREARKCQKTVCIESYRGKLDNCRHFQPWEQGSDSMVMEVWSSSELVIELLNNAISYLSTC